MGKIQDKTNAGGGEEKPKVKNTALDLQRMKLEKLMKNPVSFVGFKCSFSFMLL